MKLSGHNYDNQVFESLLHGLKDDIVLKKTAQKQPQQGVDLNFTTTTEDNFNHILDDELRFIANELLYAAKQANIEVLGDDLKKFAQEAKSQNLRGKDLERAARKYCSSLQREFASPQECTRVSSGDDLIRQAKISTVIPSGSPDGNMNNSHKGAFMGQSKNPNSIWDSESLQRLASKPEDRHKQFGDEQISESKSQKEALASSQKQQQWQDLQNKMSEPNIINTKTASAHTAASHEFNPNLPKNAMSIFSEDRDFSNIPAETAGEILKQQADSRANKSAEAKAEWNKISASKKSNNTAFVFGDESTFSK